MSSWLDVFFLIFLIALNGFFSMAEIALVASRRARLQIMIENKVKGAARAQALSQEPTTALSTIQVGITLVGLLSGIVGESALAGPAAALLMSFGLEAGTAKVVGLLIVVVLITYFSIVLGELVPKCVAQLAPERFACRLSNTIHITSLICAPFVKLLSVSTKWIMRRLGADDVKEAAVTEEEIHAMIDEGEESGVIEASERDMVRNVFRLDDRQVGSIMTPRSEILWINLEDSREVNIEKIRRSKRSRLPVCEGSLDNIKGFCSTRTVMQQMLESGKPNFRNNLTPATYVPSSLTGMELLEHFRDTDSPIALVVDEYGEVQGLVTPRDVLEAIAGQFKPETPDDVNVMRREDGSMLVDGTLALPELKDILDVKQLPEEAEGRYQTLAGMILLLLGRMPREADELEWGGWRFEVVDMDGRRIDKVLVSRPTKAQSAKAAINKIGKPLHKAVRAAAASAAGIAAVAAHNISASAAPKGEDVLRRDLPPSPSGHPVKAAESAEASDAAGRRPAQKASLPVQEATHN